MKYFNENLYDIVRFHDYLKFKIKGFGEKNITEDKKKKLVGKILSSAENLCTPDNKAFFRGCKLSYDEMLRFFEEKRTEFETVKNARDKDNYETADKISVEMKETLKALERNADYVISENGSNLECVIFNSSAMFRSVIFHDVYCENIVNIFETPLWIELSEYGDKLCLEMCTFDYSEDEIIKTKIICRSCEVRTQVFNAINMVDFDNPWGYLKGVASAIVEKEMYAPDFLCDAEREIMPLIKALVALPYSRPIHTNNQDYESLEPIKGIAQALLVYDDVVRLIDKKKINCLMLCNKKYECLWRVIYSKIADTQKDYSLSSEVLCGKEETIRKREKITKLIKTLGFSGEYPNFYKDGEITKPKQVNSYGIDYTIAFEKNCRFHIKCIEQGDSIKFICGYICLGKYPQQWNDCFSVMFDAKGKRGFECLTYNTEDDELKDFIYMPSLEECTRVAVKMATLQKLDKEEKKRFLNSSISTKTRIIIFLVLAIISGTFFSMGMAGFALVDEWISCGSFQQAWIHLKDFPWLFAALGFGIPLSAIMAFITKR